MSVNTFLLTGLTHYSAPSLSMAAYMSCVTQNLCQNTYPGALKELVRKYA